MIAYYAHSQGFGHCNAAQEFCHVFKNNALIITASNFIFDDTIEVVRISNEDTKHSTYLKTIFNLPSYAHYLPKSKNKILFRNFEILECCIADNIKFAFIDVSVETAVQFRIAGIPYAYNKMLGNRQDSAHQIAYEASEFMFAYYPFEMETPEKSKITNKTHYLGFISRFQFRVNKKIESYKNNAIYKILILTGRGGTKLTNEKLQTICSQNPNYIFTVIGNNFDIKLDNVSCADFTQDLERLFEAHDIIISSCGLNLTSEILSIKNRFIAFAEERPYNEQEIILEGLKKNNLAVELDFDNIEKSIAACLALPIPKDLESYFGTMNSFVEIKELKPFL